MLLILTNVYANEFYPTTILELQTIVTMGGDGTIEDLKGNEEVKFQTLTFQESPYQTITNLDEKLTINGEIIRPTHTFDEYGNKYANFTIRENGNFVYEITAQIDTKSLIFKIEDYNIGEPKESTQLYTKKSEKIESESQEILTLAKNKLYKKGYIETVNDAVFWVNDYVEYAKGEEFNKYYLLQRSAIQTLMDKKGVCDEFANLAAGILRAKKVPTRINIGITFDGQEWGNHAWIGTYHEKAGWIASDPTFRESGFVDATHIKIGSFADVTESLAKAIYPSTTKVTFKAQTLPQVDVIGKKYFANVTLSAQPFDLKANQWNELDLKVKNTSSGTLTVPISIKQNYKDILIQESTKAVILLPGQEEAIQFRVYPNITLKSGEMAKGNITFNSLTKPYEVEMTINPSSAKDNGIVRVKDITPIATIDQINIATKIANYKSEKVIIDFNASDTNNNIVWQEELEAFSEKTFWKTLPLNDAGYLIQITTPTETYKQNIYLEKQSLVVVKEPERKDTIIQKVEVPVEKNIFDSMQNNPEILILALLMGLVTTLLGLFLVKKQYV